MRKVAGRVIDWSFIAISCDNRNAGIRKSLNYCTSEYSRAQWATFALLERDSLYHALILGIWCLHTSFSVTTSWVFVRLSLSGSAKVARWARDNLSVWLCIEFRTLLMRILCRMLGVRYFFVCRGFRVLPMLRSRWRYLFLRNPSPESATRDKDAQCV